MKQHAQIDPTDIATAVDNNCYIVNEGTNVMQCIDKEGKTPEVYDTKEIANLAIERRFPETAYRYEVISIKEYEKKYAKYINYRRHTVRTR